MHCHRGSRFSTGSIQIGQSSFGKRTLNAQCPRPDLFARSPNGEEFFGMYGLASTTRCLLDAVELYGAPLRRIEDGLNDLQREGNPEVTPNSHCPDFFGCEFARERTPVRGVTIFYFPAVELPVVHVAIARKENCQGAGLSTTLE
jgi:hypothetical protein